MARRVFQIARDLGVKSKEVLERCRSEGVPGMDNHMTTVSAGLEASIRGWFDDGGAGPGGAAVATASAVAVAPDEPATKAASNKTTPVKKRAPTRTVSSTTVPKKTLRRKAVKKKATPKKAEPEKKVGPRAAASAARLRAANAARLRMAAVAAGEAPPTVSPERALPDTKTRPGAPVIGDDTKAPAAAASASDAAPTGIGKDVDRGGATTDHGDAGSESPSVLRDLPRAVPNVPERPESVTPAGPQLEVQQPAKVIGPKLVRVERADVVVSKPRAQSRPDLGAGGGRGAVGPSYGGTSIGQPGLPTPSTGFGEGGRGGGVSRRNARRKSTQREGRSGQPGRTAGGGTGRTRNWGEQDLLERERRLRGAHGFIKTIRRDATKRAQGTFIKAKTAREAGGVVKIEEPFSIKKLSAATGVRVGEILKELMTRGIMTSQNSGIDAETAAEIMLEYGIELVVAEFKTAEDLITESFDFREAVEVRSRTPVVAILGHVDHGKTSLLDRIRNTNVAAGEAGGITQHTSSFRVNVQAGDAEKMIVFLDTPGHEAFTSMRARGAQMTDIVVLVVAADDGVMPQTVESINHAKAAGVPIIIALNKMDKSEATETNIQRIFAQLAEHDLSPVEWGGKTELVKCSALKGEGIQDLLDTIDYQAELLELTADHASRARGTVIEARMVEGRGPVGNVLIQEGRIKIGDFVVMGRAFGRVRDMTDDRGRKLKEAGPATPLEISGISAVPDAGDRFYVVESLKIAEQAAEQRLIAERERTLATPKVTLDTIFSKIKGAERPELNLIVKSDVQGSMETINKALSAIGTDEVSVRVLHAAVGGVLESDVLLAEASNAIIIGFHVIASAKARELGDRRNIEIRTYQVIYELLDDVKKAAEGLLAPELREEVLGHAEVRQVFKVSKVGMIAGCYVTDGSIERNAQIRVTRNDIVVENARVLEQLKRFKDDAREVRTGQECGMKIEGYDDIKAGDVLECYKQIEVKRTL